VSTLQEKLDSKGIYFHQTREDIDDIFQRWFIDVKVCAQYPWRLHECNMNVFDAKKELHLQPFKIKEDTSLYKKRHKQTTTIFLKTNQRSVSINNFLYCCFLYDIKRPKK